MFKIGLAGSFVKLHSGNIKPNARHQNNGIDHIISNSVTLADVSDVISCHKQAARRLYFFLNSVSCLEVNGLWLTYGLG